METRNVCNCLVGSAQKITHEARREQPNTDHQIRQPNPTDQHQTAPTGPATLNKEMPIMQRTQNKLPCISLRQSGLSEIEKKHDQNGEKNIGKN
jgi:hypothetical protein